MSAEEMLRAGDLPGALQELEATVRGQSDIARHRVFLFQLLAVLGQWNRAVRQLQVAAELDRDATAMAQTYREAIVCEVFRERVFAGEKEALILGEPADWIAMMVEALKYTAQGRFDEGAALRSRAFELAPATAGVMDDVPFAWIADADMRLGPIVEAVVNGKYYWVPFSAIEEITFEPPADLRDVVWLPATLRLTNAGEFVALIPTRYAGVEDQATDSHRLSRETSWMDLGSNTFAGIGQRQFATDAETKALMDIRSIRLSGSAT